VNIQAAIEEYRQSKQWAEMNEAQIAQLITQTQGQLVDKGMSRTQFIFCYYQLQKLGLDGLPYLHVKTYRDWQAAGRQVRKGEKSQISSLTFVKQEVEGEPTKSYPKMANLFHISQTDPIEK